MSKLIKRTIVMLMLSHGIFLYPGIDANGQGLDVRQLGHEALSRGAGAAATYFLYADYMRNPSSFKDHEVTAFLLTQMKEYSKADSLLRRVLNEKNLEELSDSLRYFYYYSRATIDHLNNDNVQAILSLSKIEPNVDVNDLKADCYEELGLMGKAIEAYESLSEQFDPYYLNCKIGNCYRVLGQYSTAIDYYLRAVEVSPDSAYPYYGIGWSYELSGDEDNALNYYDKGLSLDQSYAYLYLMRGELLQKRGEKEMAESDFRQVLSMDKNIDDGSCRQFALYFLGRSNDAINWMNRIISHQPNNSGHYYDKACLCSRMGLLKEAIETVNTMFQKGYRKFAHLDADDDIDPIRNMPEYIELYNKYHAIYMDELEQLKDIL